MIPFSNLRTRPKRKKPEWKPMNTRARIVWTVADAVLVALAVRGAFDSGAWLPLNIILAVFWSLNGLHKWWWPGRG